MLAEGEVGSQSYFDQVESERYRQEPFIRDFADFDRWRGRRVLEIGVGMGTDFIQFARAGAILSGIDLTETGVTLVRRRLENEGLTASVAVGDAEHLEFPDASFDLVYSWGVLHHTPKTEQALSEVRRVLSPSGEARIMLYNRHSWLALAWWGKHAALHGRPWLSFRSVLANDMESPGTQAFTEREMKEMFSGFRDVRITPYVTIGDRKMAGPLAGIARNRFGWYMGIIAAV